MSSGIILVCYTTQQLSNSLHCIALPSRGRSVTKRTLSLSYLVEIVCAESVDEGSFTDSSISESEESESVGRGHLAPVH